MFAQSVNILEGLELGWLGCIGFFVGSLAQATIISRDDLDKQIYFVSDARLTLRYSHLGVSKKEWDELLVEISFRPEDSAREAEEIRAANPGYQALRAVLAKAEDYSLEIPVLRVRDRLDSFPGLEGPWAIRRYVISQGRSAAARDVFASDSQMVDLSGRVLALAPERVVVDRASIEGSICSELTGDSLFALSRSFAAIVPQINATSANPATRELLKRQVLRDCVYLEKPRQIRGFRKMLSLESRIFPRLPRRISVELEQKRMTQRPVPLRYNQVKIKGY